MSGIITFPSTKVIFLGLISPVPWFAGLGAKHAAALHIPPLLKWNKCLLMDVSTRAWHQRKSSGLMNTLFIVQQNHSGTIKSSSNSIFITASHYSSFYILVYLDTNHSSKTTMGKLLALLPNKQGCIYTIRRARHLSSPFLHNSPSLGCKATAKLLTTNHSNIH